MEDNFWNKRYAEPDYAYGKEPNEHFKHVIDGLKPGKILLPGEGEGRNAVYAAIKGWKITAIDLSNEGRNKALKLAAENNVDIEYTVSTFDEYNFTENEYDAIALIFVHFNQDKSITTQVDRKISYLYTVLKIFGRISRILRLKV